MAIFNSRNLWHQWWCWPEKKGHHLLTTTKNHMITYCLISPSTIVCTISINAFQPLQSQTLLKKNSSFPRPHIFFHMCFPHKVWEKQHESPSIFTSHGQLRRNEARSACSKLEMLEISCCFGLALKQPQANSMARSPCRALSVTLGAKRGWDPELLESLLMWFWRYVAYMHDVYIYIWVYMYMYISSKYMYCLNHY